MVEGIITELSSAALERAVIGRFVAAKWAIELRVKTVSMRIRFLYHSLASIGGTGARSLQSREENHRRFA